jgi:hypothetical protein
VLNGTACPFGSDELFLSWGILLTEFFDKSRGDFVPSGTLWEPVDSLAPLGELFFGVV